MRSRSVSAAVVAMLCVGCATGRELRVHAERGAPIVPQPLPSELAPKTGYMLVNPAVCLHLARGGGGGDGLSAVVVLAAMVGCAGLLGAVDLVALPVQAVRRRDQWRDLEEIGLACPLEDPASRVARGLAATMVGEFGFSPAPAGPDSQADGDVERAASAGAVRLRVKTNRFVRSSRVRWEGLVQFRGPEDELLWERGCAGHAPERDAGTFAEECEAARQEIAGVASACVSEVAGQLRALWPKWEPRKGEPEQGGVEMDGR